MPHRILCLSHLVWEERLFQRPQQLMTRFAAMGHDVLYLSLVSSRRWLRSPADREFRFAPRGAARNLPFVPLSGRLSSAFAVSRKLVEWHAREYFSKARGKRLLWIQHPSHLHAIDHLAHDVLVYDCMDPFGAFSASMPGTVGKEKELLKRADIVFTGGRSLHAQRKGMNTNMHCFPSGIDFDHFASAAEHGPVAAEAADIEKPVLGYFGAVDERIDWELVRRLCNARPEWSVLLIGPLVGMSSIPVQASNLYWLGGKPYADLPDYLRAFDVALIPWLVNDLTRFMSPTKTPEYLASGCPVVSTPVPDVISDYGDSVGVGGTMEEFINCCDTAVRRGRGPAVKPAPSQTWEEIAQAMMKIVENH